MIFTLYLSFNRVKTKLFIFLFFVLLFFQRENNTRDTNFAFNVRKTGRVTRWYFRGSFYVRSFQRLSLSPLSFFHDNRSTSFHSLGKDDDGRRRKIDIRGRSMRHLVNPRWPSYGQRHVRVNRPRLIRMQTHSDQVLSSKRFLLVKTST